VGGLGYNQGGCSYLPRAMPRKLKTYQTSLGFFDQAIAAPSMKAALEAWGADSNLFRQGVAKETGDPEIVAATMAKPGVVLRRPVGSNGLFTEHAELPTDLADGEAGAGRVRRRAKPKKAAPSKISDKQARKEREQKRRDAERRKEERHGRSSANGAKRRSPGHSPRWTRPGVSTSRRRRRSRPSAPLWTNARKPRRAARRS